MIAFVVNVRSIKSGLIEGQRLITQEEAQFPGFVKSLVESYQGTEWYVGVIPVLGEKEWL